MVDRTKERATVLQADPSQEVPGMPPNFGDGLIPHVVTFQGILATISKVYRASDEALKDSYANARYMLNDLTVLEVIEQRMRSTALLDWHLEIEDDKDLEQVALKDCLSAILRRIPRFMQYREALLRAIWYGKYGVQHRYRWTEIEDKHRVIVERWQPVHGDKLVFGLDEGGEEADRLGIRVGPGLVGSGARMEDWRERSQGKVVPTEWGLAYFLDPWERDLIAVHKHLIEDGEFEEPVNAGRIHGLGIRSRIYWTWFQKQECLAWLMEYLERSAFGMEIWYYPWGNDEAREKLRTAAEERIGQGRNILLVPRPMGDQSMAYGVERIETSPAGAEAVKDILVNYFGHLIKRYVIGQTLTTEAEATGLGSNLAAIHLDTYMQIIKYDSINLGETITEELVDRLKAYNFPRYTDVPVRFVIETETSDAEAKLKAWKEAFEMGARLKEQDVMDLIGAAVPEEGDRVLEQKEPQPMGGFPGGDGFPGAPPQNGNGAGEAPGVPFERSVYAKGEWDESKHPRGEGGKFAKAEEATDAEAG